MPEFKKFVEQGNKVYGIGARGHEVYFKIQGEKVMWDILKNVKSTAPLASSTGRVVKCSKKNTFEEGRAFGAFKNSES
eukprot:254289-Karenia_brevis.AAC.1